MLLILRKLAALLENHIGKLQPGRLAEILLLPSVWGIAEYMNFGARSTTLLN